MGASEKVVCTLILYAFHIGRYGTSKKDELVIITL